MASPQKETPPALRITRTLPAPPQQVFKAWTNPEALKKWFAPTDQHRTSVPMLELKVGGRYRIEMRHDAKVFIVVGVYQEIRPPDRLVFTWRWESEPDHGEAGNTLVTLELKPRGSGTELTLTHERFVSEQKREEHAHGWAGCLNGLERFLS